MSDQRIQIDLAFDIPIDNFCEPIEAGTAHVAASPMPAHHKMSGIDADFCTVSCNADHKTFAPRWIRAFESLSHHLRRTDAFERVVRTAIRQLHQMTRESF